MTLELFRALVAAGLVALTMFVIAMLVEWRQE